MDYYVICYDQLDNLVTRVGCMRNLNGTGVEFFKTREEVISDLYAGMIIYTAQLNNKEIGYRLGSKVRKVWVGGTPYISTEWNHTRSDNLNRIMKCD